MTNILDVTLGEAVTYDPQRFSYEILPNEMGRSFYYADFDWPAMIDETYGNGIIDVDVYDSVNIFGYFDGQVFIQGSLDSLSEKYSHRTLERCFSGFSKPSPDEIEQLAIDETDGVLRCGRFPDNAIYGLLCNAPALSEWLFYGGSCSPETTIRELISYSDMFYAVEN